MAYMWPQGRQSTPEIIKLNVGGIMYTTSRSTLTKYPDSMLATMFSGRLPTTTDEHGNYWIDDNGDTFRYVLDFLRRGRLIIPEGFQDWELLECEGDFYQIREFIGAVRAKRFQNPGNQSEEYIAVTYHSTQYSLGQGLGLSSEDLKIHGPNDAISYLSSRLLQHRFITNSKLSSTQQLQHTNMDWGAVDINIRNYIPASFPFSALKLEILNFGFSMWQDVPDSFPTTPGKYTYWFKRPKGNST